MYGGIIVENLINCLNNWVFLLDSHQPHLDVCPLGQSPPESGILSAASVHLCSCHSFSSIVSTKTVWWVISVPGFSSLGIRIRCDKGDYKGYD
jgi:hypothetical protein